MRARRQQLGEERNSEPGGGINEERGAGRATPRELPAAAVERASRSEEHTSELQSHSDLVCRLLLEKKKKRLQNGYIYRLPLCMVMFVILVQMQEHFLVQCQGEKVRYQFLCVREKCSCVELHWHLLFLHNGDCLP